MDKNKTNILNYDIVKLKNNLNRILEEKNISQSELAERIGMQQSGVSVALDVNKSNCFTVSQLACISTFLGVSTDDLLGIEPIQNDENISLSDVIKKIFEINSIIPIKIGLLDTGDYIPPSDIFDEPTPIKKHGFLIDNDKLENVLNEWDELNNCSIGFKDKLINSWKDETIEETKSYLAKYNYKTLRDYGKKLACELLNEFYGELRSDNYSPFSYSSLLLATDDNKKTLKEYKDTYALHDLAPYEYDALCELLKDEQ